MKRTEKYWTINFREEDHDGLVRCYRRNGTESFRLLWENVADCKFAAELEVPGIYFIVEKGKDLLKRPRVYVGQSTKRKNQKAMLNRVKEHKRAGEFTWADDVVFLITPPGFGPTELNYLENTFHDKIKNAGRYRCDNKVDPHNAELHEEIVGVVNDFIEDAEDILAIFGHRLFTPAKQLDGLGGERVEEKIKAMKESWETKTQLAKIIARRGGNEGAYGGILHFFSNFKPCGKTSKWRKPLEEAGIKFDDKDMVIDWSVANNPL